MTEDDIERNKFAMEVGRETIKCLGRALLEEAFTRLDADDPAGVSSRPPVEQMIATQLSTLVWDACQDGRNVYGYCVFASYGDGRWLRCVFCGGRPVTPGCIGLRRLPEGA